MDRRSFLTAAAASIFVPQFGRFFREGSGLVYRPEGTTVTAMADLNEALKQYCLDYYRLTLAKPSAWQQLADLHARPPRQFMFGVGVT